MAEYESTLEVLEQNHKNIVAIATELGAEDRLTIDVTPRSEPRNSKAKFLSLDTSNKAAEEQELDDEQRAARLLVQNAENLKALADAVGVEKSDIDGDPTAKAKTALFVGNQKTERSQGFEGSAGNPFERSSF